MRFVFLLVFILSVSLSIQAGTVFYNGVKITYDDNYSLKSFQGIDFSKQKMNGLVIYATSFFRENPDTHVFPDDMTGTTFYNCNLDNVFIPPGNTVIGGTQRRFKVQNDLRDWQIDLTNTPTQIMNSDFWIQQGYSTNTADIPLQKIARWQDAPKTSTFTVSISTP